MRIVKHVGVATVLLMMSIVGLSQQLRLGKNPYALQKSAILELESDNQGLLFPRILDTTLINSLTPPDGMVIFHQPSRQLMVRSNGHWNALAPEALLNNYWTINGNSNGGVKKLGNVDNFDLSLITNNTERLRILANGNVGIGNNNPLQKLDVTGNLNLSGAFMPANNAGTAGYVLRSNGAGVAPSWISPLLSGLSDVTITTPANGQLLQYNGTKWVNTTPAYLTTIDTSNISNFYQKVRGLLSAAAPLSFANGQFSLPKATTSVNGYLSSTDWTTFNNKLSSVDTSNISNFFLKVRSLSTATAPITYANGQIGITQASTSTNGYLSSADWNTFNNKAGNFTTGNLTETGSAILTITGGTNAIVGSGVSIQAKQATALQNGFLSNADWTTFNNKLSSVDTTNISNFSQKVRKLLSGGTGISYNNTTGAITNAGVTSLNGNTGALTMDTGYINNFYLKSRGLLSAGTGIAYNATTGVISSSVTTGNLWNLSGNAGTTPASQFLGTTDAQDLSFRTNNSERMRLDAAGRLGIGTATPATALHVAGTNPLTLNGVQTGAATDSLLTIDPSGTVKKMKASDMISVSAITNLNGLTAGTQTFAVGTAGTDFNISSSSPVHTFNLPNASATARGLVTTAAQTIAGSKTFSSAPLFSSLTTGSVPFIGTGGLLSQNNASLFWDATNNRLGIGTNAPGSDLTLSQSAGGAGPTKGFRFTGNSISGVNGGTGFSLALGYNITNNKQLWLGDADYLGNGTGTFVRYSSTNGQTILDGIDGTNAIRRPISIGVGGDPNSAVILGSDGSSASPASYIWANGEMAIGSGFRNTDAPANGLAVQGSVAIGSSALDATYPEKLLVDAGVTTSVNAIAAKGTIDSYLQLNIQNKSAGTNASSDIVATANNGNETSNYIDMGINGSAYSGGVMGAANDGYIYNLGQNLLIGTGTASKSLVFMTGGTAQGTNERMRIDGTGSVAINTTTPNSSTKLDVSGAVKLGAKGTVEKNVISFEISFASNTTVPGASMNTLFSTFSPGALETTVTIPAANTPTTTRGSVSISADQDLPSNVSIASARISSTTGVKVRFLNSGTGNQTIPAGLKLYVTITEF
jgi:hypothetical protein